MWIIYCRSPFEILMDIIAGVYTDTKAYIAVLLLRFGVDVSEIVKLVENNIAVLLLRFPRSWRQNLLGRLLKYMNCRSPFEILDIVFIQLALGSDYKNCRSPFEIHRWERIAFAIRVMLELRSPFEILKDFMALIYVLSLDAGLPFSFEILGGSGTVLCSKKNKRLPFSFWDSYYWSMTPEHPRYQEAVELPFSFWDSKRTQGHHSIQHTSWIAVLLLRFLIERCVRLCQTAGKDCRSPFEILEIDADVDATQTVFELPFSFWDSKLTAATIRVIEANCRSPFEIPRRSRLMGENKKFLYLLPFSFWDSWPSFQRRKAWKHTQIAVLLLRFPIFSCFNNHLRKSLYCCSPFEIRRSQGTQDSKGNSKNCRSPFWDSQVLVSCVGRWCRWLILPFSFWDS